MIKSIIVVVVCALLDTSCAETQAPGPQEVISDFTAARAVLVAACTEGTTVQIAHPAECTRAVILFNQLVSQ